MASGFSFYKNRGGGPTETKVIEAGGTIYQGDPITVNGATNDEALAAVAANPAVLGVAVSAGTDGDDILYIPATHNIQFLVTTGGTTAYTDATFRNEIQAIDTSGDTCGILLANTNAAGGSFVIDGYVNDSDFSDGTAATQVYGHFINTVADD